MNLYLTADKIVPEGHGGGSVTFNESEALKTLGTCEVWDRDVLIGGSDPWKWDEVALNKIKASNDLPRLCHIYSGTFSQTVRYLRSLGTKVVITCAAHRVSDSKKAHEDLGIPYNYPHLTDPEQWKKYSAGYREADILVVPSTHSETVVKEQGCTNKIEVIPHGGIIPHSTKPIPKSFVVGYLGSFGADKGVKYLLQAWKKLNYKDGLLVLAGKDSTSDWGNYLINTYGGGNIHVAGWQDKINDFYDKISLYCQSSCTEGFGLEVLEAHAHARCAICSDHAGAVDLVHDSCKFEASSVDAIVHKIEESRKWDLQARGSLVREQAFNYSWDKVKKKYIKLWKGLLES